MLPSLLEDEILGPSVLLHAALQTAKISLPTVLEARRGVLKQSDCDRRLRSWARSLLAHVGAEVSVVGKEHLRAEAGPFVVVSNHQSLYDIPVLYAGLPLSLRMAAKAELFKTPLWGPALRASGFVEINRTSPSAARAALQKASEQMRRLGTSLYIAPEGTRSEDGTLGRFKKGAFHVAHVTGFPILPVVIFGTREIHEKGGRRVHEGRAVTLTILPPVSPQQCPDVGEMTEQVRAAIASTLAGEQTVPESNQP